MNHIAAHQAKNHFGQLLDQTQQEPVTIEKHGRPVAVMLSMEQYHELEEMKLEHLRQAIQQGEDDLKNGKYIELLPSELHHHFEQIKSRGRDANLTE